MERNTNAKLKTVKVEAAMMGIVDIDKMPTDSISESNRTPVIVIDGDDLPQDGGTGRYTIGGIETQLNGTPASESGQLKSNERPVPNGDDINPLDKKK